MRFLPGLEPSLFQNAMVVKDEFGQPGTLLVVKGDWEALGNKGVHIQWHYLRQ